MSVPKFDIDMNSNLVKTIIWCVLVTLGTFLVVGFCEGQFNLFTWSKMERTMTLSVALFLDIMIALNINVKEQ